MLFLAFPVFISFLESYDVNKKTLKCSTKSITPNRIIIIYWWNFGQLSALFSAHSLKKKKNLGARSRSFYRKNPGKVEPARNDFRWISWALEQWNFSWRLTRKAEYQHWHGFSIESYSQTISVHLASEPVANLIFSRVEQSLAFFGAV